MTLDDNLAGISMSAEKGMVEDTNTETIRFREKIIALYRIDDPPPQLYNKHWFFIYTNCPCPHLERSTNLQIIQYVLAEIPLT